MAKVVESLLLVALWLHVGSSYFHFAAGRAFVSSFYFGTEIKQALVICTYFKEPGNPSSQVRGRNPNRYLDPRGPPRRYGTAIFAFGSLLCISALASEPPFWAPKLYI